MPYPAGVPVHLSKHWKMQEKWEWWKSKEEEVGGWRGGGDHSFSSAIHCQSSNSFKTWMHLFIPQKPIMLIFLPDTPEIRRQLAHFSSRQQEMQQKQNYGLNAVWLWNTLKLLFTAPPAKIYESYQYFYPVTSTTPLNDWGISNLKLNLSNFILFLHLSCFQLK